MGDATVTIHRARSALKAFTRSPLGAFGGVQPAGGQGEWWTWLTAGWFGQVSTIDHFVCDVGQEGIAVTVQRGGTLQSPPDQWTNDNSGAVGLPQSDREITGIRSPTGMVLDIIANRLGCYTKSQDAGANENYYICEYEQTEFGQWEFNITHHSPQIPDWPMPSSEFFAVRLGPGVNTYSAGLFVIDNDSPGLDFAISTSCAASVQALSATPGYREQTWTDGRPDGFIGSKTEFMAQYFKIADAAELEVFRPIDWAPNFHCISGGNAWWTGGVPQVFGADEVYPRIMRVTGPDSGPYNVAFMSNYGAFGADPEWPPFAPASNIRWIIGTPTSP